MSKLSIMREKSATELKRQANVIMGAVAFILFLIASVLFFVASVSGNDRVPIVMAVIAVILAVGVIVVIVFNRRSERRVAAKFLSGVSDVASGKETEIDDVTPEQFSIVCAMMFLKCGYRVKLGSPDSMDGASLVVKKKGVRRARIRCEMACGRINEDFVREFAQSRRFHRFSDLILITNGYLMKPARRAAAECKVTVIERDRLRDLLKSAARKRMPKGFSIIKNGK
jgi:HJR/Mrr/RecB family endonuclease